jgi:hypothetical protein
MATPKTTRELNLGPALGYDPDFGGLCLDGFPHLVARDDTPIDDGLAPLDTSGTGAGSSALKAFLSRPDREAIVALRDPEALRKFDEQQGDGTTVYANEIRFKIYQRDGRWHAKGKTPDGTVHRFSSDTRDSLFPKISQAVRENTVRALTDAERLQVVRIAQSGDTQGAIVRYLRYAIGDERGANYADHTEMLGDPALAEVFDDAAVLTWFAARPNVSDSQEWSSFLDNYAGNRPLSHGLLDGAWTAFEKQQRTSALFAPVRETEKPPTARQIDDLDDASVDRLMVDTKKQFAREVRAGVR